LLKGFASLINNYKIKHKMFISSIIRRSKTTIIVFKISISTSLVNIIVLILLLKKRNRLSKTTKNASIFKKKDRLFTIKIITNNKKDNDIEILF
jgi:hypothetical protein